MLRNSIAWKNGQWLPLEQVHLELNDWGVLQGATVVDRLRTINSEPLDLQLHFDRLVANCESIGIEVETLDELPDVIVQCALHNRSRLADRDFSIVVLVTPGTVNALTPTRIVHIQPLRWPSLEFWYQNGQPLIVAQNRNVPKACWSPQLKTRSRLQYYLADQEALQSNGPHAGAVLLDLDGNITETSAANVLIVDDSGNLCAPPEETVLGGISMIRTLRLAAASGFKVIHQPLPMTMIESVREVILTGTSGCIWPASSFGSRLFNDAAKQPVYTELLSRWISDVGCDFRGR